MVLETLAKIMEHRVFRAFWRICPRCNERTNPFRWEEGMCVECCESQVASDLEDLRVMECELY